MMDTTEQLAARRQVLLARSEGYRSQLALELTHIRDAAGWVPQTLRTIRTLSPVLVVAVPLAGFLLGRRLKSKEAPRRGRWLGRILAGIQMYRRARGIIETLNRFREPPGQGA